MFRRLVWCVFVAIVAAVMYFTCDIELVASRCPADTPENECPDRFFSTSYFEARGKFRASAKKLNAELSRHPVYADPQTGLEYTIDSAVVRGTSKDKVLVHISGTHGTEGYVGSAIQGALLESLQNGTFSQLKDTPTIVFVHALNPTGMAFFRRWNHNNVDLHRNCLPLKEQWEGVLSREPNFAGYEDFSSLLNPQSVPDNLFGFLAYGYQLASTLFTNGMKKAKKITVTGQYHNPQGIFYGGNQLEKNYEILFKIIEPFKQYKHVSILDVHSGLGSYGKDTFIVQHTKHIDPVREVFVPDCIPEEQFEHKLSGKVGEGYELAKGGIGGLRNRFDTQDVLVLAEEFGTRPGVLVALSLIWENAAYHQVPNSFFHERTRRWQRNMFYVPELRWKQETLGGGVRAFSLLYKHTSEDGKLLP